MALGSWALILPFIAREKDDVEMHFHLGKADKGKYDSPTVFRTLHT
jgi:hypothetical protein